MVTIAKRDREIRPSALLAHGPEVVGRERRGTADAAAADGDRRHAVRLLILEGHGPARAKGRTFCAVLEMILIII